MNTPSPLLGISHGRYMDDSLRIHCFGLTLGGLLPLTQYVDVRLRPSSKTARLMLDVLVLTN